MNIAQTERVQRLAARFIASNLRTSPMNLCKKEALTFLEILAKISRLKFIFQLSQRSVRVIKSRYLKVSSRRAGRQNHRKLFSEWRCRNNCFNYPLFPLAVSECNALPSRIVHLFSVESFTVNLKNYLGFQYCGCCSLHHHWVCMFV